MRLSAVGSNTLFIYKPLLVPEIYELLQSGEINVALGLTQGDIACGVLAGYVAGYTFHLSSLFIAPDFRGRGGANLLMKGLQDAMPSEVREIQAHYCITNSDHKLLQGFLEHFGFIHLEPEEPIYRISLSEISSAPFFLDKENSDRLLPFRDIPPHVLKEVGQRLALNGEQPFDRPLHLHNFDQDVSVGLLRQGELEGFLVVDHSCGGHLTLSYLQTANPTVLPSLLRSAFRRASKKYSLNETLYCQCINQSSLDLITALLPNCEQVSRIAVLPLRHDTDYQISIWLDS